ncbi:MAG: Gfo/Idh/MocA family protein [Leadbetterella sp.]
MSKTSRRKFIEKGSLAVGSFFLVPRHVLGKGYIAPSDKLNIAGIGSGGKGDSDLLNSYNKGANNIVALCDVDTKMTTRAVERWPNAKRYTDFRKMLSEINKDIDAVTISTPDHFHAVAAMACMQMGKHVYVQKPLTHNIAEARMLTEAARKYKVVTQMGNQGSSNPLQKTAMEWFDSGLIGTVDRVEIWTNRPVWPQGIPFPNDKVAMPDTMSNESWDVYLGPAEYMDYHPMIHPFKWRGWWNFGTGALGDIGCHTIDSAFRILGLGYPNAVECSVGAVFTKDWVPEYIPEGCPPSSNVEIKFSATDKNKVPLTMAWMDGGIRPMHHKWLPANEALSDDGGANGLLFHGTKGLLSMGMYGLNPKIYFPNGDVKTVPKVDRNANAYGEGLPEWGHQVYWADACKEGFGKEKHKALTSSFDYSGPLTETVLMGNLAIRSYMLRKETAPNKYDYYGRKQLLWDGKSMKITNLDEANQFVGRSYRPGWEVKM